MGLEVISIKSSVQKQLLHTGYLGISQRLSLVGSLSSAVHLSLPDYCNHPPLSPPRYLCHPPVGHLNTAAK